MRLMRIEAGVGKPGILVNQETQKFPVGNQLITCLLTKPAFSREFTLVNTASLKFRVGHDPILKQSQGRHRSLGIVLTRAGGWDLRGPWRGVVPVASQMLQRTQRLPQSLGIVLTESPQKGDPYSHEEHEYLVDNPEGCLVRLYDNHALTLTGPGSAVVLWWRSGELHTLEPSAWNENERKPL